MEAADGRVLFSQSWPMTNSTRESMDYFYDWLSYHLPQNLSYGRRDREHLFSSLSSPPTMYAMKETMDGRHIIYDSRLDDKDPPTIHYGYILYKKKTQ